MSDGISSSSIKDRIAVGRQGGVLMHWFGVALWRRWYPSALADVDVYVLAVSAFAAIETAMQAYQIRSVAYAAADLLGGSLHYRAHKVCIVLDSTVVLEALSFLDADGPARSAGAGVSASRSEVCVLAAAGAGSEELEKSACYPCLVEVKSVVTDRKGGSHEEAAFVGPVL